MKRIKLYLWAILLLCGLSACNSKVEKKEIAIIAPYERSTQIWQDFVDSAKKEFADTARYDLHFYYVYTYVGHYWEKKEYERDLSAQLARTLNLLKKEIGTPDLIIIEGDVLSHSAARLDEPLLEDTPIICTDVICPEWKDLLPLMSNVVVMEAKPEVKKNLDFIQELGFSNYVVTVMDSTYVDDKIRDCILAQIGDDPEHYRPNLHLEQEDRIHNKTLRDSRVTLFPISTMWPEKNDRHPDTPGSFKYEWIFNTQQQETSFLHIKHDEYSTIAMSYNIGPFFTMTPEYFNMNLISALNYCIGGYFTPFPSMWEQIHPIADKILNGTEPKMIPWGTLKKDYWLDWRLVKQIHPYANQFPKGVKFVNLPWDERSKTLNTCLSVLLTLLIVFVIIYAIIIPSRLARKQKKQRALVLKKAQEADKAKTQVEFILSQTDSYVWRMLPDLSLKFSPSFYTDFGIPEGSSLDCEKILQFILEPGRSEFRKLLYQKDFEGESDMEVLLQSPSWEKARPILLHTISLSSVTDEKHKDYHLKAGLFYFNDESYQKNEELRKAYRRSEEIKEKEKFLASMDDKFLKPVDNIIFFSKLLSEHFGELNTEQKSDCEEKVMSNNDALMELLDKVMGDTQQQRSSQIKLENLNLAELMEEIYISHSVSPNKKVRLEFHPGPDNCEILANRAVLSQIMNSLITEAFNNCKGKISIGWEENAELATVIYIDNAFNDIANCSQMIEPMGGKIEVYDYPGSDTRVELVFPITPPDFTIADNYLALR